MSTPLKVNKNSAGSAIDSLFFEYLEEVKQRSSLLAKDYRLRIKLWIQKLQEPQITLAWKKNRNEYTKLLLMMLRSVPQRLEAPFDRKPEEGPLKQMQKWLKYSYEFNNEHDDMSGKVKSVVQEKRVNVSLHKQTPKSRDNQSGISNPSKSLDSHDLISISSRVATASSESASQKVVSLALKGADSRTGISNVKQGKMSDSSALSSTYKVNKTNKKNRLKLEEDLTLAGNSILKVEEELAEAKATIKQQQLTIDCLRKRLEERYQNARKMREDHRIELQDMIERYEKRRAAWSPLVPIQSTKRIEVDFGETNLRYSFDGQHDDENGDDFENENDKDLSLLKKERSKDSFSQYLDNFQSQTDKLRAKLGLEMSPLSTKSGRTQ